MQVSAGIHKMEASWRDVGEISILLRGLIGCNESRQQYCQVQRQKKDCGGDEFFRAPLLVGFHA
jgi:MoaA/NifB/PqqE/SkfB family radical SAM enzyme